MTELQLLFDQYNRQYFGGKLPRYRVMVSKNLPRDGNCDNKRRLILINSSDQSRTLLHEMCHIGAGGHGKRVLSKLRRLASLGSTDAAKEPDMYTNHVESNRAQMGDIRVSIGEC